MALDPLKFAIAIEKRNLEKELKEARKTLENGLKDVPIHVKVANLAEVKKQLEGIEVRIKMVGDAGGASSIKSETKDLENLKKAADETSKSLNADQALKNYVRNLESIDVAISKLTRSMDSLKKSESLASTFGGDVASVRKLMDETQRRIDMLKDLKSTKNAGLLIKSDALTTPQGMGQYAAVWKEMSNFLWGNKVMNMHIRDFVSNANMIEKAMLRISTMQKRMEGSSGTATKFGFNNVTAQTLQDIANWTAKAENTNRSDAAAVRELMMEYHRLATSIREVQSAQDAINRQGARDLAKQERDKAKAVQEREAAQRRAIQTTSQLSAEEQRLARAIEQSMGKMNQQSQVLSDLKSMAAQYLSVYAGQQFLSNIIEIGGQLEMQRLSIGAILQDTAHATDLFDKIKGLALQSPFGVVELDQYTKQLSAYGFQYNELYDMTKRLADISAGAGTDVSRLALALGHVRSEGALTGYTLRQFAMNNIPMLGKLSEKLSELEGRIVTAGEVRKRVSKKEIDYAMVESVIKDLTNEGGMFYNMQEVISGSVKAKWKNLRDAFDVMYGEMAESAVGGALKGTATMLTALAKQWKTVGTEVLAVAAIYGTTKVVMMAYNTLLGQQTRAVFAGIAAERQAELSKLRMAQAYRTLTREEMISLTLGKGLRMSDLQTAISAKKLTADQLAKSVALGKVSQATAIAAIRNSTLAKTEKDLMISTVNSVRTYGRFTGVVNGLSMAFRSLLTTMKAIIANPMTWIMAAVSGVTYLWQKNNEEMERAKEISKQLTERASEGVKNVRSMMSETGMTYTVGGKVTEFGTAPGGTINYTPASQMDGDAMIQTMERWEAFIKDYSSMPNTLLKNALFDGEKMRDLSDQYERLAHATESVMKSQLALAQIADSSEFILKSTETTDLWGVFDDDLITNMNDYAKSAKKADAAMSHFAMSHKGAMKAALNAAKANADFNRNLSIEDNIMVMREQRHLTEEEQLKVLVKDWRLYRDAIRDAEQAIGDIGDREGMKAFSKVYNTASEADDDELTMKEDMASAADAIRQVVKEKWHKDISELKDYEQQALLQMVSDIAAKSGESTEAIREHIIKLFADELKIPIDIDQADAAVRISFIQQELNKLVAGPNGEGYPIDIRGVVDANDLVQKVREAYKKAKDTITNLGPIAIKMGLSLDKVKVMTKEEIDNAAGGSVIRKMALKAINDAYKAIGAAETTSKEYGFDLIDSTKGGKVFKAGKDKTGTKGSKEDKDAKELREKVRVLKEAESSFQYWRKLVGKDSAFGHVGAEFGKLLTELGLKVDDVDQLRKKLTELRNVYEAKPKTKAMTEALRELDKTLADLDRKDFEKLTDESLSGMERELDRLTERWERFNSVRETTGDKDLAAQLAGLDEFSARNYRNAADELVGIISEKLFDDKVPGIVDFDKVFGMSEDEIEDYVKSLYGGMDGYEQNIKAIIRALKEWQKLERGVINGDIDMYSRLIANMVSYEAQMKRNNDEYARQETALRAQLGRGEISQTQFDEALRIARTMRDSKNAKLSSSYLNLMNGANALTRGEALDAIDNAVMHLNEDMAAGLITMQDYADQLAKLKDIEAAWNANAFFGKNNAITNYLKGGNSGLMSFLTGRRDNALRDSRFGEADEYQKYIDQLNKVQNTLGDLSIIVELVASTFDGLQRAATAMANMFDALGQRGKANRWGDIADGIGAVGSIFNPVSGLVQNAQSGNIGGLVSSAISAPFEMIASPITAFAQLHDKKRERQIEQLREDVKKIDNTLNLIRTGRGRTLGYDNGSYRRLMAAMYANDRSSSGKAMTEYYSRGGLSGSGYTQELEALKKQRQDYIDMYNKENAKKKSSTEALEEYKMKMAELDDQIMNYSEELAQELWSIDLKGWADQIGDALMNAFENGTSAATAFEDATRGIMQSVVTDMLKVGFIQPMMENLRQRLFGENGAFDPNDPKGSMGATLSELGRFFGQDGEGSMMMTAASEFLSGAEELLNANYGMTLKSNGSSTQTKGIQSQATEESIGILSGQMARIAQDVSVKRIFITQLVTDQMPKLLETSQMQRSIVESQLQSIRAIEHAMIDGDGAMFEAIDRMSRKIDRAITPEGRMRVE